MLRQCNNSLKRQAYSFPSVRTGDNRAFGEHVCNVADPKCLFNTNINSDLYDFKIILHISDKIVLECYRLV